MPLPETASSARLTAARALALPLTLAGVVAGLGLLDIVRVHAPLSRSFLVAGTGLAGWAVAVLVHARARRRVFVLHVVLRRQHYLQACAQAAIFVYWGWYWRPVYGAAHLIAVQILFAYAFDMLLVWSRRETYTLGFGPFPVILSINLFLWFKPEWFWLQFLIVAVGFAVKDLVCWDRDGRRVHIFNPSSFPLAVASLVLLATGTSETTWGQAIASTQVYPPHMYLFLFLVGLPNGLLFGVASMTMSAVLTTYLFGLVYFAATGVYYFYDTSLPVAVFLGMHFLFTDPSTSPRSEQGRVVFGVLYGAATVALYALLGRFGLPTFYDKLLPVPVLNLSVRLIDRVAKSWSPARVDTPGDVPPHAERSVSVMPVVVWVVVFCGLTATRALSDQHPGQWAPFWQQACADERRYACDYLLDSQASLCRAGSGWGCNELGILQIRKRDDHRGADLSFRRGCELGFEAACQNRSWSSGEPFRPPPRADDLPLVLRGSRSPMAERDPEVLFALACERGFAELCEATTRSP